MSEHEAAMEPCMNYQEHGMTCVHPSGAGHDGNCINGASRRRA